MSDRGGGLTRDVILRISAQNLSTADFRAATAAVNELTAAVDKQIEAAARGTVKEKELTETLAKLGDVSKNLQGFSRIIENLKGLDTQIAAQIQKLADAKKAWETQQATMDATANVTQRMKDRLAGLENAYKAADKTLNDQIARQQAYRNTLQQNGLDVQNLANAERQLLAVADQAGAVVNKLTLARDNYAKILRQTREEELAAANAAKAAAAADVARAAAIRQVAEALERERAAEQARRLAEVQAGAKQYVDRAEAERRIQKDIATNAAKTNADLRATRMAAIREEVEANNKRREESIKAERSIAESRAKAAAEVAAGARNYNEEARRARMEEVRRNIEENNRLREVEIRAERESERRASLGRLGRLREDIAERRRLRRQELEEQEAELRRTTAAGGGGGRGAQAGQRPNFLGLRAYEMTNLGYQGVDVAQGLLAGTSGGIIAAQQGPQILQIFGLAALKWAPVIVAALGTISVAVGAFQRTMREAAAGREFGGLLAANAQSVNYNKQQLIDLGKAARDMGMSWKEGIDAIKIALSGNIGQDYIKTLLQAAQDVKDVYGTAVPDAMKQFTTALSGSGDELIKLGSDYRLFSREEQEYIRQQVAAGKVEEARRFTIERLAQVMRERAKEALSPWAIATRELSKAWDDFLISVSKTDAFKAVNDWILTLIGNLGNLGTELDKLAKDGGIGHKLVGALVGPKSVVARALNELRERLGLKPLDWSETPFAQEAGVGGPSGGSVPTNLAGNQKSVADWLTSHGYNAAQAAAIMGNVQAESSFNPAVTNASGHFGLFQWDKTRQAALGSPPSTDIVKQLELMDAELTKLDPNFKKSTDSYIELTRRFRDTFERPIPKDKVGTEFDTKDLATRTTAAGKFYQLPTSTTPSATSVEEKRATPAPVTTPVVTGPTPDQIGEGGKALEQDKERYAIAHAISVEAERKAEYDRISRDINQQNKDPVTAAQQIQIRMREVDLKLQEEQRVRQEKLDKEATDQAKHLTEIRAVGEKAVADARARGITGYRELQRIEDDAKTREADRLTRIDDQNEKLRQVVKTVDDLKRANDNVYKTDIDRRIDAVRVKYKDLEEQLKKNIAQAPLADAAAKRAAEAALARLPAEQKREEAQVTGQGLLVQAQAAASAREDLIGSYKRLQDMGAISISEQQTKTKEAFAQTTPEIEKALNALEKWLETAKELGVPALEIEKTRAKIAEMRTEMKYVDPEMKALRKEFMDSLGSNASKAFDTVGEAIGGAIAKTKQWKDVWTSLKTAAMEFFAGVLKDMAKFIIEAQLKKALSGLFSGSGEGGGLFGSLFGSGAAGFSGGGVNDFGGGSALAAVAHSGGVIGHSALPSRNVEASWFANAPRYHTGGVAGLAANEQAAILQNGEEVLAGNSPRNIRNWGQPAAPRDINIRNVLVADPELVPSHMGSARGEKVIMNVLKRNSATVRQLVS